MTAEIKRCRLLEGIHAPMTEVGGYLVYQGHPMPPDVFIVGRRAGRAGILISKGKATAVVDSGADIREDIAKTIEMARIIRHAAGIISKIPRVGRHIRGADIETFIDYTEVPEDDQDEARRAVADALRIHPSLIAFGKRE